MRDLAGYRPAGDFFSWRGNLARKGGIEPGSRSDEELIQLMASDPGYLRRPILRSERRVVAGFDETAWLEMVRGIPGA